MPEELHVHLIDHPLIQHKLTLMREKETGSMEVLLASPMPPLGIVLAKAVPWMSTTTAMVR